MHTPIEMPVPDLDLLDVQGWSGCWAEIERRIGAVFARSETRTRAMAYLAGLLTRLSGKIAGSLPRSTVTSIPMAFSTCWAVPLGSRTTCAIGCAPM
jgi:hypothetical protein